MSCLPYERKSDREIFAKMAQTFIVPGLIVTEYH